MSKKLILQQTDCYGEVSTYDAEVTRNDPNDHRIKMKYHENGHGWTDLVRGKTAVKLHDDGDGVTIKFRGKKKSVRLDYSQLVELSILLDYYHENSGLDDSSYDVTKFTELKNED